LNIGRLEKQKNQIELIKAAEQIKKLNYNIQILIIGHGRLRQQLQEIVKLKELEEYVKFIGLTKDINYYIEKSHVFIMSSSWEGMPISLLEAGIFGLPVLSTPVGSIPSIINSTNGYLSSISNLSSSMIYIFENYEEALKKGKNLQGDIKRNYYLNNFIQKHESLYRSAIND
jgi:glycosyltransferase involved in cell wall biosynthesis